MGVPGSEQLSSHTHIPSDLPAQGDGHWGYPWDLLPHASTAEMVDLSMCPQC